MQKRSPPWSWLQPAILTGSLLPFLAILYRAATHRLGANPIATALNQLGLLALVFLVACLACTPLKLVLDQGWPIRVRKTLGNLAFFAALAHFLLYVVVDQELALGRLVADVLKRPFIAVGFIAFVLLIPLALTSTKGAVGRLGFARWKRIHRMVYVIAILAVVHFTMRVKADTTEPLTYGAILLLLFGVRIFHDLKKRTPKNDGVAA
jgi:sulfoxide reductase heme-binding subunit YedZ